MPSSTFSVRMDQEIKHQFDTFCAEVGMSTSTAINLFARVVVRNQKLPFDVSTINVNERDLVERAKDFETGNNIVTHNLIEA